MSANEIDFSDREALESAVIDDGVVTLRWVAEEGQSVEVQQSTEATFQQPQLRYQGADPGTVLTGLPEGTHHFRIRSEGGNWSPGLSIDVVYFPEAKLWLLLGIGGVVVIATIGTILAGSVNARRREASE